MSESKGVSSESLDRFWTWWATARDRLAAALDRQTFSKQIAEEITSLVDLVHPSLIWELGPGRASTYALTLCPEGDLSLRRLTGAWLRAAPPPDEAWEYHAARPPTPSLNVQIEGAEFSPSEFSATYEYDDARERFHVAVHHPQFGGVRDEICRQVALLTLDQLLGEDDVDRWVQSVDVVFPAPSEAVQLDELIVEMERRRAEATGQKLSLGTGLDRNGGPVILMFNGALKQIDHLDHVHHLAVFMRLQDPRPDGLPGPEEAEQLNEVEERLLRLLGDNALQIGRLTLAGRREVHFYVRDPELAEESIAAWRAGTEAWSVNHEMRADPLWSFAEEGFYRSLAPNQE